MRDVSYFAVCVRRHCCGANARQCHVAARWLFGWTLLDALDDNPRRLSSALPIPPLDRAQYAWTPMRRTSSFSKESFELVTTAGRYWVCHSGCHYKRYVRSVQMRLRVLETLEMTSGQRHFQTHAPHQMRAFPVDISFNEASRLKQKLPKRIFPSCTRLFQRSFRSVHSDFADVRHWSWK